MIEIRVNSISEEFAHFTRRAFLDMLELCFENIELDYLRTCGTFGKCSPSALSAEAARATARQTAKKIPDKALIFFIFRYGIISSKWTFFNRLAHLTQRPRLGIHSDVHVIASFFCLVVKK
jgi:hypothetical protein